MNIRKGEESYAPNEGLSLSRMSDVIVHGMDIDELSPIISSQQVNLYKATEIVGDNRQSRLEATLSDSKTELQSIPSSIRQLFAAKLAYNESLSFIFSDDMTPGVVIKGRVGRFEFRSSIMSILDLDEKAWDDSLKLACEAVLVIGDHLDDKEEVKGDGRFLSLAALLVSYTTPYNKEKLQVFREAWKSDPVLRKLAIGDLVSNARVENRLGVKLLETQLGISSDALKDDLYPSNSKKAV